MEKCEDHTGHEHEHKREVNKVLGEDESFGPSYSFSSDTSGGPIDFSKKKIRPVIRDSNDHQQENDREHENEQEFLKPQRQETCFNSNQTLKRTAKINFEMP